MSLASEFVAYWKRQHDEYVQQIDSEWIVINRPHSYDNDAPWLCHCCASEEGVADYAYIVNVQVGEGYRTIRKMKPCQRCNAKPTDEIMAVYHLLTLFKGRK